MTDAALAIHTMDSDDEQTIRAACAAPGVIRFVVNQEIDKKFKHFVKSLGLLAVYAPLDLRDPSAAAIQAANCAFYSVTIS